MTEPLLTNILQVGSGLNLILAMDKSENPAIGELWARIPDCNYVDVDRAVQAAKSAFYDGPWS